jgi:hypothetical protein
VSLFFSQIIGVLAATVVLLSNKRMMTSRFLTTLAFTTIFFTAAKAQQSPLLPVHIGLIYPLSTNGLSAPYCSNRLSLHAIASVSRMEKGAAFPGLANIIRGNANGIQFAGFSNHIARDEQGMQAAGFLK